MSRVISIRRTVTDAALAGLARKPGRPAAERNWELEAARPEIGQLTEAIKGAFVFCWDSGCWVRRGSC